jgi:hypothetical protein
MADASTPVIHEDVVISPLSSSYASVPPSDESEFDMEKAKPQLARASRNAGCCGLLFFLLGVAFSYWVGSPSSIHSQQYCHETHVNTSLQTVCNETRVDVRVNESTQLLCARDLNTDCLPPSSSPPLSAWNNCFPIFTRNQTILNQLTNARTIPCWIENGLAFATQMPDDLDTEITNSSMDVQTLVGEVMWFLSFMAISASLVCCCIRLNMNKPSSKKALQWISHKGLMALAKKSETEKLNPRPVRGEEDDADEEGEEDELEDSRGVQHTGGIETKEHKEPIPEPMMAAETPHVHWHADLNGAIPIPKESVREDGVELSEILHPPQPPPILPLPPPPISPTDVSPIADGHDDNNNNNNNAVGSQSLPISLELALRGD